MKESASQNGATRLQWWIMGILVSILLTVFAPIATGMISDIRQHGIQIAALDQANKDMREWMKEMRSDIKEIKQDLERK